MSELSIKTDNKWKNFKYFNEVPSRVLKRQFAHLEEGEADDGFFKFKGYWYHLSDFMTASGNPALKGWDGYASDSYFSGTLIKLSSDGEQYKVAQYFS